MTASVSSVQSVVTPSAAPAPCECPLAGYCARHQRQKTPHLHQLCRTRAAYRALWDGQVQPPRGPCAHLGELLGQAECATCAGRWRIKLFACGLFGQCTLGKKLPGVATCRGCPEFFGIPRPRP